MESGGDGITPLLLVQNFCGHHCTILVARMERKETFGSSLHVNGGNLVMTVHLAVVLDETLTGCEHFFEWNARTQITTWNPTSKQSGSIPDGPSDYVSKHWSGLIKDYYGGRASLLLQQALADYNAGHMLSRTELARLYAVHAYKWTTDIYKYPTEPTEMCWPYRRVFDKYKQWFALCVASLEINGADINDA
jgi:hypothetical protein